MEPEDFDMKVRSANENTSPPFENEAWDKMELLLEQHLPQKKERQGFFFWWFIALIPIGLLVGYCLMYNSSKIIGITAGKNKISKENKTNEATNKSTTTDDQIINTTNENKLAISQSFSRKLKGERDVETTDNLLQKSNLHKEFSLINTNVIGYKKNKGSMPDAGDVNLLLQKPSLSNNDHTLSQPTSEILKSIVNGMPKNNNELAKSEADAFPSNKSVSPAQDTITSKEIKTVDEKSIVISTKKSDHTKKESKNHLYLSLTSGVEANGTSLTNLGAATPVYGAGVQYVRGKIFIRTGVLVTKKLYAAKDKDYTRKTGTWMSIVTFDNIDANCKVIEIPLSIGYNLTSKKKTSAYITAGTSAYFMKKEEYQFYFKNQSGNDTTRNESFKNISNNFFTSINISAGIEQKITNRLSITAEPTIKIPIGGIGFGKVKVYSAGLLITAKIKLK